MKQIKGNFFGRWESDLKKIKLPNLDWTFYATWINLLLMKHKLLNFDWFVNNLIVRNLLITELNKTVNTEAAAQWADFLGNRCCQNFRNIQRKRPVLEYVFNKVAGQQLSREYCKIFKSSFFHKTRPVAASEKFVNFQGKYQLRKRNRFIFLSNTTE